MTDRPYSIGNVPYLLGKLALFTGGGFVFLIATVAKSPTLMLVSSVMCLGSALWDVSMLVRVSRPGQPFWTVPAPRGQLLQHPQEWTLSAILFIALVGIASDFHGGGTLVWPQRLAIAALVVVLLPFVLRKITRRGFDPYERPAAS